MTIIMAVLLVNVIAFSILIHYAGGIRRDTRRLVELREQELQAEEEARGIAIDRPSDTPLDETLKYNRIATTPRRISTDIAMVEREIAEQPEWPAVNMDALSNPLVAPFPAPPFRESERERILREEEEFNRQGRVATRIPPDPRTQERERPVDRTHFIPRE